MIHQVSINYVCDDLSTQSLKSIRKIKQIVADFGLFQKSQSKQKFIFVYFFTDFGMFQESNKNRFGTQQKWN
ncbi:hypothetical protein Hanom_Chr15g01394271 [Helianthus anomalus]